MNNPEQQIDANKLIETLSSRHAQKIAQLEREVAVLVEQTRLANEENENLRKQLGQGSDQPRS